ncbi:alcohol dehydrogenase catalytic domain-containing protein [Nonomuraea sp. NPDC050153]|uniref:alcohol dehydrogenase catalytic domain-containing protein n=1 Tax=Nonomuraea sp. NPDC050153 TaxID=3364359 RepID=UPI0037A79355
MRALVAQQYGPPDLFAIKDLPVPEPGPCQLQVRVRGLDQLRRLPAGRWHRARPGAAGLPAHTGHRLAGTVTRLGPDADGFEVGDEVFGFGAPPSYAKGVGMAAIASGAMAEYAVVTVGDYLAERPDALGPEVAAALPSTGMTGLAVVEVGEFEPGEKVLVIGAGWGRRQRGGADAGRAGGGHRDGGR